MGGGGSCAAGVRSLVGWGVPGGCGGEDAVWPGQGEGGAARKGRVKVRPAHGLCLEEVGYPADAALADRARESRARRDGA